MKAQWHLLSALLALPLFGQPSANILLKPGSDAAQAVDEERSAEWLGALLYAANSASGGFAVRMRVLRHK